MARSSRAVAKKGRGQVAAALAAFVRRQGAMPLEVVATDPQCLDLVEAIFGGTASAPNESRVPSRAGRKRNHDRAWAESCLLDLVLRDPDGLPDSQTVLVARLRECFEAAGRPVPGETWLKNAVRKFHHEAVTFETAALELLRASPPLQAVFENEASFLAFRRAKMRLEDVWTQNPGIRGRYSTPSELLESVMNSGISVAPDGGQFAPIRDLTNQNLQCNDGSTKNEDFENGTQA